MQAYAVIGAGFGDEGKGLITDYLVHQGRPDLTMVVRFNGGAQAGHTVVTPQGKRHVFSHFGSGTLAGASTFLSEHFIVNPHLFCKEVGELVSVGCEEVTVIVDPRAVVTTPYDMFINRAVERQRAGSRHGSVGVGINETIERSGHTGFKLTVGDLWDEKRTLSMLRAIREHWVPQRLKALGICGLDPETEASFASRHVIPVFMDSVSVMRSRVHLGRCSHGQQDRKARDLRGRAGATARPEQARVHAVPDAVEHWAPERAAALCRDGSRPTRNGLRDATLSDASRRWSSSDRRRGLPDDHQDG
jgi:hypothetical protein